MVDVTDFQDPVQAIVTYLGNQKPITDMTGNRIYGDALPPTNLMPNAAVAIRWAGGGEQEEIVEIIRPRLEVRAYGTTDQEAAKMFWRVYGTLHAQENLIVGSARILSIMFDAGPVALIEETLNTPFKLGWMNVIAQFGDP